MVYVLVPNDFIDHGYDLAPKSVNHTTLRNEPFCGIIEPERKGDKMAYSKIEQETLIHFDYYLAQTPSKRSLGGVSEVLFIYLIVP